jgi:nicotinamidase-related amidase
VGGKSELSNPLAALANIEKVLAAFRKEKLPVIHVQHISVGAGATFFLPGTKGTEIHERLTPKDGEFHIIKHFPNSFQQTELASLLADKGITELVVCGMMSHMCIDTTVRACKDYGLNVTLLEDACATKSLAFQDKTIPAQTVHEVFMASLNGMFATVKKTSDII